MSTHRHHAPPIPPDLELIRRSLAVPQLSDAPPEGKLAAVAVVLAGESADLHVCLILRADHEHDRWSGHVALPGGRVEVDDTSACAAAVRESREEVGLRLDPSLCLGALEARPVSSAGRPTGMTLFSFVFYLGETLEALTPSDEVAEAFWVPLRHLLNPRNASQRRTHRDGVTIDQPAVLYEGRYIWGLTYRVLTSFFEVMQLRIAGPR
jgi:8-oxo-dGTP pyrophosphatase MutT (NUDIX family)